MRPSSPFAQIRPGERLGLVFSALFSFVSIGTVVVGRSLSDALLLSARPEIDIAHFFIVSSVALMVASSIYFALVRLVAPARLHAIILMLFSGLSLYLHVFFGLGQGDGVIFASTFLTIAPALLNIICWNAITDYFDSLQGRRLFHIIFAASTVGGIASGLVIPPFIHRYGVDALFYAEAVFFAVAIFPAIVLSFKQKQERTALTFSSAQNLSLWRNLREGFDDFWQSSLLKTLGLVVFLTAISTNIIDFALKDYLRQHFNKDEIGLFYGHYNAVANAINLIFQLVFVQNFLRRFRVSTAFYILPVTLLILSVPYFLTLSFVAIVGLKFMDAFLRFTMQDPAREIAIAPIPYFQRNRAKIFIKGLMNPFGAIVAGALLMATQGLGPRPVMALVLVPTLLIWLFSLRKIDRDYAHDLMQVLSHNEVQSDCAPGDQSYSLDESLAALQESSPVLRQTVLESLPQWTSSATIPTNALEQVLAHETQLAAALSLYIASFEDQGSLSARQSASLQSDYDDTIYRIFKILALMLKPDVINAAYRALVSGNNRTRAQGMELFHLECHSLVESAIINILIDDLSHGARAKTLRTLCPNLDPSEVLRLLKDDGIACVTHNVEGK